MKAIIIEDETATVNSLEAVPAQNMATQIEVVAELESIEENVGFFRTSPHPDTIFVGIHLADKSALKIFEQVETDAPVIFTTTYDEYALQAFQVSSTDYLLKPVTLASLEGTLNKLRLFDTEKRLAHIRQTDHIIQDRHTIKNPLIVLVDKFYPLAVEEILYFCMVGEKVVAYTSDGEQHPVDRTLDALGEQLDERLLFRTNRRFVISCNAIKGIDSWFENRLSVNLTLPAPERIIISKAKTPIFKKWVLREEE